MNPIASTNFKLAEVPSELWAWVALTMLMTAVIGFSAGLIYARMSVEWAFRKARKRLSTAFTMVIETLETAERACATLGKFPELLLTAEQSQKLEKKRGLLVEMVSNIVERQLDHVPEPKPQPKPKAESLDENIAWITSPEDATTGLPDRSAFDLSFESLLQLGGEAEFENGLLLIKIDKFDQLKARFESHGAERFLKKMASVICLSIRDADLVCRFSTDCFGVLMPHIDLETGRALAESIRNVIRGRNFRLDASGPEVLVTASFGYTHCPSGDNFDLALNRVGDALAKSQKKGRNQLHVHDGAELVHCSTANA